MRTRHVFSLLLAGAVLLAGLVTAQEPAREDADPPLRLKKKKRNGETPPARDPAKEDKEKGKEKEPPVKAKEEEPIVPEDGGPPDPDEDDKEVLERIARNMRSVEEKLGNRELGDPTAQQQRDILKDIDALIRRSENQQNQGGGGADQQPMAGGEQNDQDRQGQAGSRSQRRQRSMAGGGSSRQKQRNARAQRRERPGGSRMMAGEPRDGNPEPKAGGMGNNPGAGGRGKEGPKDINADLYKDVWGHLPESLRAEMNAYSNPRPFMPRYDDLIRKYYRTIAEQGRKKGD